MIDKVEIFNQAGSLNLPHTTIEKDYVIGWILAGISCHPIASQWVFKGGTCLKKSYLRDYRFSEDLDFSIPGPLELSEHECIGIFQDIAYWVRQHTNVDVIDRSIRFDIYTNPRQGTSAQGRLNYIGPLRHKTNFPGLKIDVTGDELIVYPPAIRPIFHDYSDAPLPYDNSRCYSFTEILAEKMMALSDRTRPRDLYDVINIHAQTQYPLDSTEVGIAIARKCEHRKIVQPSLALASQPPKKEKLERAWSAMLKHQLPKISSPEHYWERLEAVFDWLKLG